MLKIYNTNSDTQNFSKIDEFKKGSWINLINPTDQEIEHVCNSINIDQEFIRYALDYEEKARIDIEEDNTLFIIDVPIIEKNDDQLVYTTMPIGMIIVRDDYFLTVSLSENKILNPFEENKVKDFATYMKSRFIFQILYNNASTFLNYLKQINKEIELTENELKNSLKNKELLKLLSLEKSLVYFTTSLKSNELVMEKTMRGKVLKLYEDDEEILEDAIIENKQAIEMSKIYSDILSGTMDAYASIISNNLNVVMKFLTSITIILSIPTMIASFWGMNVALPLQNNVLGFIIIVVISIIVALLATQWLKKRNMLY